MEIDLDQPAVVGVNKTLVGDIKVRAGRIVAGRCQCQSLNIDPYIAGGIAISTESSDVIQDCAAPVDDLDIEIVAADKEHIVYGIVDRPLGAADRLPLDRSREVNDREDLRAGAVGFNDLWVSEIPAVHDEDMTVVWIDRHILRVVAA